MVPVAEIRVEIGDIISSLIPKMRDDTTTSDPTAIGLASSVTRSRAIKRKTVSEFSFVEFKFYNLEIVTNDKYRKKVEDGKIQR